MIKFYKFYDFLFKIMVTLAIVLEIAVGLGFLWVVYKLGMKVIGG